MYENSFVRFKVFRQSLFAREVVKLIQFCIFIHSPLFVPKALGRTATVATKKLHNMFAQRIRKKEN